MCLQTVALRRQTDRALLTASLTPGSLWRIGVGHPQSLGFYQSPVSLTSEPLGLAEPSLVPFLFHGLLLPSLFLEALPLPRGFASSQWVLISTQAWDVFSPQTCMLLIPITTALAPRFMGAPNITPKL